MKKILIFFIIFSFMTPLFSAEILEIGGGLSVIIMGEYNDSLKDTVSYWEEMGGKAKYSFLNTAWFLHLTAITLVYSDLFLWGITVVTDYFFVETENKLLWPNWIDYTVTKENYNCNYIGIGLRWYFINKKIQNEWCPFIGLDGGIAYTLSNFQKITMYNPSGNLLDYGYANLTGLFPGFRCEVGVNYWFNDFVGFFSKICARYMKGTISGYLSGLNNISYSGDRDINQEVDYSGVGLILGFNFYFDWLNRMESKFVQDDLPSLPQNNKTYEEFVKKGDIEYNKKFYKIALGYYLQAIEIKETAYVYKKIGNCYYYIGNKEEAKKAYEKSLKLNPLDIKLIEWLENLK